MSGGRARLEGKTALITGAGNGIGFAMAQLFVAEGARVAAVVLQESSAEKWRDVANVIAIRADITKTSEVERAVDVAERELGKLDILCNVAGINDLCYPLHETTDERWDRVMNLDLRAPFLLSRRAVTGMLKQGGGVILNVGSYAAERGNHGPSYTAAKHGLIGLTLSMAVAYANQGIRCNAINPGSVRTDIGRHSGGEYHPQGLAMFLDIVGKFPVKWACEPSEIARAALFLCSDESKHINGAVLAVDGGMSAC